jgi:hypothetical protein
MKSPVKFDPSEMLISIEAFLKSYNATIPEGFPKASLLMLRKYREDHASFFKHKDEWSLAEHRKRIMDWLLLNSGTLRK